MLDEFREYEQYTGDYADKKNELICRLKFSNLVKNDFCGLNRAMTIIARYNIFHKNNGGGLFNEDEIRNSLSLWCDNWLTGYIRHMFFERDCNELVKELKESEDSRNDLLLFANNILQTNDIDSMITILNEYSYIYNSGYLDVKNDKKINDIVGRIKYSVDALVKLSEKKRYFSKRMFNFFDGEHERGVRRDKARRNSIHMISYDRIIANALDQGQLHRYYLVCKSDSVPFNLIRKTTPKTNEKKLIDTDMDLILKMTASYLLQKNGCDEQCSPDYVVISLTDISNWMIKKDKPSNFELDKYRFLNTGERLFDKRVISSGLNDKGSDNKTGNLAKTYINHKWIEQFYLIDEKEIDNPEHNGRIFFSDYPGEMLFKRQNIKYS
ncbi:hypothetical protein [Selenomonas sp. FC4001]|uniref:hypothetical protein n=1 Tax=Selenomonas sp. FC4001 TaxID=1408313 RepID=UPI0005656BA9|nr:hypothetical protein [Selenomonas sp. FC4001]